MANLNTRIIFAKIVKANSFSEAARRLEMPVSTISRRIADFEDERGVRLLQRSTRPRYWPVRESEICHPWCSGAFARGAACRGYAKFAFSDLGPLSGSSQQTPCRPPYPRVQGLRSSWFPETEGNKPQRSQFKRYPIGFFHIDIAEVRTEQGRLYLFVAIDRTSKFAFVELHEKATPRVAGDFLRALVAAVPYKIHTVLTDNGTHFTAPTGNGWTPEDIKAIRAEKVPFRSHSFELTCADLNIQHRLTKPRHPWTNGQVERMNRTIKEATVRRFYYETHDLLRQHLADFVAAYNFARRLKTLRASPHTNSFARCGKKEPSRFRQNPHHQIPGPNI
jgi:transposase InsO family protein